MEVNKVRFVSRFGAGQNIMGFASFLMLVLVIGLRWETATDWDPYLKFFNSQLNVGLLEQNQDFEIGYVYLTRLIHLISPDYSIFLIIHALIFLSFLYLSYKHLVKEYFILAITLYFAIYIGMTGSNRQLLAIAIGLFAVVQLTKKNFLAFFLLLGLAMTFHTTAILLVLYLFFTKKIPVWIWIVAIVCSVAFGLSNLPGKIFGVASLLGETASGKVEFYGGGDQIEGSVFGVLKRLVIAFVFLFLANKFRSKHMYYDICLNGFLFSVVMFFLFKQLPVMGRANLYFNIMEPVLMTFLLSLFKDKIFKNLILGAYLIMSIFYFRQSIQLYPQLFVPYKGIWINQDYARPQLE